MSKFTDHLHNAIFYAVLAIIVLLFAAGAGGATIWLGVAWGIVIAAILAALVYALAVRMEEAGYYALPVWVGIAAGLSIGLVVHVWRFAAAAVVGG